MPGEAIRVEGLRELNTRLRKLDADLPNALKAAGKEAAEPVAFLARQLAPYDTGDLGRSVRTGATRKSATVKAGGRRAPYAGPIHFGWRRRHITPQPFLYSALDRRRDEVVATYTRGLERLLQSEDLA